MKKRIEISVCIAFVLTVFISMTGFAGTCDDLKRDVFRLHILANSDSREDQELKLKVRDRLLGENIFTQSKNKEEAMQNTKENIENLTEIAKEEIIKNGYDYDVTVQIVNMYFTTREYESFTLPAGNYDALRVLIGKAEGKNWWCVMFPPLCLPAASDKSKMDDVFTDNEVKIITQKPKYKIKFKTVEIFEEFKNWFS